MSSTTTHWINPAILLWARKRLRLSHAEVEKQSNKLDKPFLPVSVTQLKSWESSASEPDLEQLETLAEIYVCPLGYFFLAKEPAEELDLNFRGLAQGNRDNVSAISEQTLHRFFDQVQWVTDLIGSIGVNWSSDISKADLKDSFLDIAQRERNRFGFNENIRNKWLKPIDAFQWWRKQIEGLGVFCFVMKLGPKDIRGASLWTNPRTPAILVNHEDLESHTGRTFTLLHEYCHLLLKKPGYICDFHGSGEGSEVETYANRFAAHILVSQSEFEARLRELKLNKYSQEWTDYMLSKIKEPFFVSKDVIAIRLEEMKLAPKGFYNFKKTQWAKLKPFGRATPGQKRATHLELKFREIGFSMAKLLSNPSLGERIPKLELSYALEMKIKKTDEFLNWLRDQKIS